MRSLLIDNYDSFTWNLFHLIAEVNGEPPIVIRNDEPRWQLAWLVAFDNVVISPGPGHPARLADFGICSQVIAHAQIPVLGVCLGHQGIAVVEGGEVDLAPEPRHGRVSVVTHAGIDILQGIPSPFFVVRYHSLSVRQLPASLEALAYSEDGVLMAMRHRTRPLWGVQFHPESICTEHGRQLLDNFAQLTQQWQGIGKCKHANRQMSLPMGHARFNQRCNAKSNSTSVNTKVLIRKLSTTVTTEQAFARFYAKSAHAFWLDSNGDPLLGRFSIMGDDSGPLARVVRADVVQGTVTVKAKQGTQILRSDFFDWLQADLARWRVTHSSHPPLPFDFLLGWVGYLGYELKAQCDVARGGASQAHHSSHPDATLVFADRALVFDHMTQEVYLLALVDGELHEVDESVATRWMNEVAQTLATLNKVNTAIPSLLIRNSTLQLRHPREEYLALVQRCKDAIVQGESYELCLTNMISVNAKLDVWQAWRELRHHNPVPFGAYLSLGELKVLSSSPERFMRITASGRVESKPIKGTRRRGRDAQEDQALKQDLIHSEKDRAENLMIVDLVRNDLGICAETGSVNVDVLFGIESFATVHQMVSTIAAQKHDAVSAVDIVRAAFPGGSMTGAPKLRTLQILNELEQGPRGIYSGAIGYFSLSGAADFNIVIRTLVVKGEEITFGVGGAITALSDAADEYEETAVKAASLLRLLQVEFPQRQRDNRPLG